MLLVCPTCSTAYAIDRSALGAGRKVRCARCKATWFAALAVKTGAAQGHDFGGEPEAPVEHAILIDAPSLVPPIGHAPLAGDGPEESVVQPPQRRPDRQFSRVIAPLLLLFAAGVAIVGAREEVVRYLPRTAPLFAAIGLPVAGK